MRGADNMALDDALMARARETGEGVVRVYSWIAPTLSLGRNQRAAGCYDRALAGARGYDIVRRPTGGRAILHHREITYSVTAPSTATGRLRTAYENTNALLLEALHVLGVAARLAGPAARALPPGTAPCFEHPSAGELVVGMRKLVGSAQYRDNDSYLQHGSILVHDDQQELLALTLGPVAAIPPAATLADALTSPPTPMQFAEALFGAVRRRWDPGAQLLDADPQLVRTAALARDRYLDDAWTWRR